jgi:hypothetical protein
VLFYLELQIIVCCLNSPLKFGIELVFSGGHGIDEMLELICIRAGKNGI